MAAPKTKSPDGQKAAGRVAGVLTTAIPVLLLTALAAGAGTLWGMRVVGTVEDTVKHRLEEATPHVVVNPALTSTLVLKKLSPVVTNLAGPGNAWVRIEASLVMEQKAAETADPLAGAITEDILAFLRSVTAAQMQGATGLKNLREDLSERVAIRSKGVVRDIVIETLVIQ